MSKTNRKETNMTIKLATQIFDAWIGRKHSGLCSVTEAADATCAEFGITPDQLSEAFRVSFRAAA
jgi:hypothetical protein